MRAAARTTAPGTILCCSGSDGVSAGSPCRLPSDDDFDWDRRCCRASCRASSHHHARGTPTIDAPDGRDGLPCQRLLPSPPRPLPPPSPSPYHFIKATTPLRLSPTASGSVSCTSRCRRRVCGWWYGRSLERRPILLSAKGHSLPSLAKRTRLARWQLHGCCAQGRELLEPKVACWPS